MLDDFDMNIQCEELEDYFNYNDRFEDPRYLDEEGWYGAMVKWPKTPPFHGGNTGSNPVGVTKEKQKFLCKTNVRLFRDLKRNSHRARIFIRFSTTTGTQPRRPLRYAGQWYVA